MASVRYPSVVVPASAVDGPPTHLVLSVVTRKMLDAKTVPLDDIENFCAQIADGGQDVPATVRTWVTVAD